MAEEKKPRVRKKGSPPPPKPPAAVAARPGAGRIIEKVLENPTLVIAGLAAVPLLFLAWGLTRRRRRKRREEEILEDDSV